MIAVKENGQIAIGQDFVEAVTGKTSWIVEACGHSFAIRFPCTGDEACKAVKQVLASEGKKTSSFTFQRSK